MKRILIPLLALLVCGASSAQDLYKYNPFTSKFDIYASSPIPAGMLPLISLSTGVTGVLPTASGGTGATSLGGAFVSTGTGVTTDIPYYASTSAFSTASSFNFNGTTMSVTGVSASTISLTGKLVFPDGTVQTTAASGGGDPQVSLTTGVISGSLLPNSNGGTNATSLGGAFISTGTGVTTGVAYYASTSAFSTASTFQFNGTTMTASAVSVTTCAAPMVQVTTITIGAGGRITNAAGAAATPSLVGPSSITNGLTTGLYWTNSQLGFSNTGSTYLTMSGSNLNSSVPYLASSGGPTNPSLSFVSDTGTGWYYNNSAGQMYAATSTPAIVKMKFNAAANPIDVSVSSSTKYAALGGAFFFSTATFNNSGTTQTDLANSTMVVVILGNVGDTLVIRGRGSFAANANSKELFVYAGATTMLDTGSLILNGGSWVYECEITRVAINSQIYGCSYTSSNTALGDTTSNGTMSQDLGTTWLIRTNAIGGAGSDITQNYMKIRAEPAP